MKHDANYKEGNSHEEDQQVGSPGRKPQIGQKASE